ncbi:MAG: hypothetical protein WC471_01440 [Candidatus Woesearchaeota archaeon]
MRKLISFFLLFVLVLFSGCGDVVDEKSCSIDTDCACGRHVVSGDCFFGNSAFVDVSEQCPDYCTGIAAQFAIQCVDKKCEQVRIR